jgi:hypothetical protein
MTVIETKHPGFLKAVGGTTVVILVGLLLFHFLRPAPQNNAIAPTEFDGFVADSASRQLLRNAEISVTLGPYAAHQTTDTFGRYSIAFASPSADATMASVEIHATGYGDYKNTIALRPGSNYAEITLNPNSHALLSKATLPPEAGDTTMPVRAPIVGKAQVLMRSMPPDFMKAKTTYVGTPEKK